MGVRDYAANLPPRWVVRQGEPCKQTLGVGGAHGMHDYMESVGGGGFRWCMWCGQPENDRGPGWTACDPATGEARHFPDYATAVRHASNGWHDSLDPLQRSIYAGARLMRGPKGLFG